jgi:hypothetical protein
VSTEGQPIVSLYSGAIQAPAIASLTPIPAHTFTPSRVVVLQPPFSPHGHGLVSLIYDISADLHQQRALRQFIPWAGYPLSLFSSLSLSLSLTSSPLSRSSLFSCFLFFHTRRPLAASRATTTRMLFTTLRNEQRSWLRFVPSSSLPHSHHLRLDPSVAHTRIQARRTLSIDPFHVLLTLFRYSLTVLDSASYVGLIDEGMRFLPQAPFVVKVFDFVSLSLLHLPFLPLSPAPVT